MELCKIVESVVHSGVDVIQVRDQGAHSAAIHAAAMTVVNKAREWEQKRGNKIHVIYNMNSDQDLLGNESLLNVIKDRVPPKDLLDALGGVHFPERMIEYCEFVFEKSISPEKKLVGTSVHSVESALSALNCSISLDYLQVGTMFPTESHIGKIPEGVELIRDIKNHPALNSIPLIGVGGIQSTNAAQVLKAGASGIASIRSLLNPQEASTLRQLLNEFKTQHSASF
eukprot:CAMPEP_0182449268 /NCGR_PEP_ID=MMETSP1172-20130603/32940_1 /TAXON_ID=708627 /ORGANISM="Timspurckia oligopyrenoides, Strain CCMP3278" /LENGTH=226 /DNA_ID=CAMNT_0024646461 /DNA_START=279 /DNA_END=959 /DNA_ORIENTATION=+